MEHRWHSCYANCLETSCGDSEPCRPLQQCTVKDSYSPKPQPHYQANSSASGICPDATMFICRTTTHGLPPPHATCSKPLSTKACVTTIMLEIRVHTKSRDRCCMACLAPAWMGAVAAAMVPSLVAAASLLALPYLPQPRCSRC